MDPFDGMDTGDGMDANGNIATTRIFSSISDPNNWYEDNSYSFNTANVQPALSRQEQEERLKAARAKFDAERRFIITMGLTVFIAFVMAFFVVPAFF
jgi:uncharacterized membrane protein